MGEWNHHAEGQDSFASLLLFEVSRPGHERLFEGDESDQAWWLGTGDHWKPRESRLGHPVDCGA
jgi:hypothetical protein